MSIGGQQQRGPSPAWFAAIVAISAAIITVVDQWGYPIINGWGYAGICAGGLVITVLITLIQTNNGGDGRQWLLVLIYRSLIWVNVTAWTVFTELAGIGIASLMWLLLGGLVAMCALGIVSHAPAAPPSQWQPQQPEPVKAPEPVRDPVLAEWEQRIEEVTTWKVRVTKIERWENSRDGFRIYLELPVKKGVQAADLASHTGKLAASARLRKGCIITVDETDVQGVAILDVMTRNVLEDPRPVFRESTAPASINDEIPILTSVRGEKFGVCLREWGMVVGGTIRSGKTTLLHRIIMYLARCTDALIWVVDLNGGGVAVPFLTAWANGRAKKPTIDWVAGNQPEAALLTASALAIARDRKTSGNAIRRRTLGKTTVLPVDAGMPAIIVLADEGGTLVTALSLFGQLAARGMTSIAQQGRAEAVRSIISVLRGTSDLLDKGFRAVSAIRLSLRMDEPGEYEHILGEQPGSTSLAPIPGAAYLKMPGRRFVFGVTENIDLDGMEEHSIATAHLRPDLDPDGVRVCAAIRPQDVLEREPTDEQMEPRAMQDAARGLAYANRWIRYEPQLASMRGEQFDAQWWITHGYDAPHAAPEAEAPGGVFAGNPGLTAMMRQADGEPKPEVPKAVFIPPQPAGDGRSQVLKAIKDAGGAGIKPSALTEKVSIGRAQVFNILPDLVADELIVKAEDGTYYDAELAVSSNPAGA